MAIIALSTCVAAWLLVKLWRSQEHLFFKLTLSVLVFIPVLGPIMVLFYGINPPVQPKSLQDLSGKTIDVDNRWRHVFEEKNPVKRFHKWRERIKDEKNL